MANNSWLSRLASFGNKSQDSSEVKALQTQLDSIVGEVKDADYNVKYLDDSPGPGNSVGDFNSIDQQIDNAALTRIYATETWVYSAVSAIVHDITALPARLEKRSLISKKITNEVTGLEETIDQAVWTDASGEKLNRLFEKPNPYASRAEFLSLLVIDLLTCGEYFIYLDSDIDLTTVVPDPDTQDPKNPWSRIRTQLTKESPVKGLYRLPPGMLKPIPSQDKVHIEGYLLQSDRGNFAFGAAEILHVKLPNPVDSFRGLSPLLPAFKPVLLDRYSTEHMIRFYKSGARLGGVIKSEKSLNKEQIGRFQRSFEANYTGRQNHHRTLILPPGMDYKQIEQNPAETALLEFCRYNREAILAVYRVPPIKVGIMDHANYANARVQIRYFFTDTIKPLLGFIQDGFNNHAVIMPDNNTYRFQFDLTDVEELQDDYTAKADAGAKMLDAGLTFDEVRKRLWKMPALPKDGDKLKLQLEIELKKGNAAGGAGNATTLSLPAPDTTKDALPTAQPAETQVSSTTPTTGTFSDRVAQLVAQFTAAGYAIAEAIALAIKQARAEGFTDDDNDPNGAPPAPPTTPTEPAKDSAPATGIGTAQNSEIIPVAVGTRKPKKPEGEDDEESKSDKPTLAEFIAENISKLGDDEEVDAALIEELSAIYSQTYDEEKKLVESKTQDSTITADSEVSSNAPAQAQIQTSRQVYEFGFSKDQVVNSWKSFMTKTNPLVEKRHAAVVKFFEGFKRIVLSRFGANIKSFGAHKSREEDDVNEILKLEAYDALLKQYIDEIDKSLKDAYEYGFNDTLSHMVFNSPNEKALAFLKAYGADEIKGITETTMEQMKTLLSDAFEEGVPVGEVSTRIQEKFTEISAGRAQTIARTETLTAVSAGREEKRQEFKEQFPDKPLKKMWVSAQDDKVRDSHQEVDGEVVGIDESFSNDLAYPRDPDGDASEVINCRCTDITFAADDAQAVQDTLPQVDPWEGATDTEGNLLDEGEGDKSSPAGEFKGGDGSGGAREGAGRKPGSGIALTQGICGCGVTRGKKPTPPRIFCAHSVV